MPPSLDARGFVRVDCAACGRPDVWLRCDACEKSDHFLLEAGEASCDCGATYAHATCLCGAPVPGDRLRFVAFRDGPMALADLEWDPRRLGLLVAAVAVAAAAVAHLW